MATKRASKVSGKRPQRGLSLLEVAIVVAIMAIVAAAALPSFTDLVAARG
ncbi:MAG: prepilin-type N-terminal cleavage/methylation domain-containing protein [Caldimonas sp.]